MRARVLLWLCLALAPAAVAAAEQAPAPQPVAAEWREHEIIFNYQDFTTQFSCLGLREKMRKILDALGVRDDAKVSMYGCSAPVFRVAPAVSLKLRFATLHPIAAESQAEPVAGAWAAVDLSRGKQRFLDRGDCALVERVRDQVLPAFAHEIVEDRTRCIPHRIDGSGPVLRLRVLQPLGEVGVTGE